MDPDLKYDQLQIDESKYLITLESSLFEDIYEEEFQISDLSDNGIMFSLDETEYAYKNPFKLNIHRLDAGSWESDQKDLWIDDIKSDSILELYGNMNDGLIVYSEHGVILEQITNIRNKSNCQQIPVGFLLSYKTEYAYIMMVFTMNGAMNKTLFCYNRCVFRRDKTRIDFDPVTKRMSVYAEYYGRGRVYFTIDDEDGNTVWEVNQTKVANGPEFDSPEVNVKSFTSIGEIYGGGYGSGATVNGDTYVYVNEYEGEPDNLETESRTIDGQSVTVSKNTGFTGSGVIF